MNELTSPAAQVIVSLIPIVGIVIGGTVVFFSLLWHHSEKKLQIKTGSYQKERFNIKMYALLIGLLLSCVGIVLSLFFVLLYGLAPALLGGLIPLALGISLLLFYRLIPTCSTANAD